MHKHIVLGGTFDTLHAGHRHFLATAFSHGARVTIGLTSARYIKRYKHKKGIAPYSKRYQALTGWLRREGLSARTIVVPLHDPFGPAILPDGFDAIAVTADNRKTAEEINTRRVAIGLRALHVVEIDLLKAEDAKTISATRVRGGEIDTDGRLLLPDRLRPMLKKPLGTVLTGHAIMKSLLHNRDNVIVSVGDVTTQTAFACGIQPSLAIIDLQVERKPYQSFAAYKFPRRYTVVRLTSGPGFIAKKAIKSIEAWSHDVKRRTVLVVEGEEDLLAIPAIVHAPVGSVVYYGQPAVAGDEGMVEVMVSKPKKAEAEKFLNQFLS